MIDSDPQPRRPRGRPVARVGARALLAASVLCFTGCSDPELEKRRAAAGPSASTNTLMRVADAARGGRLFRQCAACHTAGRGGPDLGGPNLFGVVGRPIADNPRFGYTAVLSGKHGRWTPALLSEWLRDPQRFAPGTTMTFAGVPDPLDRADLIAYLKSRSDGSGDSR